MGSRKFTDSEIRAYTRNRHEEKTLKGRLQKLKEELGDFHDSTAKHRSSLIEECRQMRKTSGGDLSPKESSYGEEELEFSTRVSRPWAYSVMETTYNVSYQEAIIPIPKRLRYKNASRKTKSFSNGEHLCAHRSSSSRILSSRSLNTQKTSVNFNIPKEHTSPVLLRYQNSASTFNSPVEMGGSLTLKISNIGLNVQKSRSKAASFGKQTDKSIPAESSLSTTNYPSKWEMPNTSNDVFDHDSSEASKDNRNNDGSVSLSDNPNEETFRNVEFQGNSSEENKHFQQIPNEYTDSERGDGLINYTEDKRHYNTRYISLPAVYTIDLDEYQKAVRKQMLQRSRSRNELTQAVVSSTSTYQQDNSQKVAPVLIHEDKMVGSGADPTVMEEDGCKANVDSESVRYSKERELDVLKSLDPAIADSLCVKATEMVTYRGKTIHNYIRPEERYKLDPIILKRRQNKMDRLAKESTTFLKRVNHENIRVEIAFPRSTRRRLLSRLVDENNFGKGKKINTGNETHIQNKVKEFIASVGAYVSKQNILSN